MSSRSPRDLIDYIGDNPSISNEAPIVPRRYGFLDTWSGFLGGILLGIAGGALIPIGPWLGGLLILAGYGMAASVLRGSRNGYTNALRFGFIVSAIIGLALIVGHALFPRSTWSVISFFADRHLIFSGVAALPWAVSAVKYIIGLFRPRQ
jgi:hypothetical protein